MGVRSVFRNAAIEAVADFRKTATLDRVFDPEALRDAKRKEIARKRRKGRSSTILGGSPTYIGGNPDETMG